MGDSTETDNKGFVLNLRGGHPGARREACPVKSEGHFTGVGAMTVCAWPVKGEIVSPGWVCGKARKEDPLTPPDRRLPIKNLGFYTKIP